MPGGDATELRQQVEELDRRRRMRNTRALGLGFAVLTGLMPVPMWLAGIDVRVAIVTLSAAFGFGAIAWATRTRWGGLAAALLNVFLAAVLFAGVAANGQIGPGPAFVGFSLFVAVATLPLRGVIAAGVAGALNVAAMSFVARGVPQIEETPAIALTYGLALCIVTTLLGVVATTNARAAIEQLVERERRAVAAEEEKRALVMQLEQAQKMDALGRMAAGVAHDFNNLLTVISAATSMARRELPKESVGWELLGDAEQATSGAAALTARLLAFSRKAPVATEVVDARKALGGLTELLPRALGPSVSLKVDLSGELPPVVAAPAQLEQVLLNLAINARDAMPKGGTMSIVARARQLGEGEENECKPGTWLEVAVSDTGTGMSKDVMAHIFEPFFTTKPPGKGTGLGLSTCYGIIRQLGGFIRVQSEVGEGTTFRVLLPRAVG
jgi:signal transduction histidine kinase